MQVTSLEDRVTILEDSNGGNDNSSIVELEVRVSDLETDNANQQEDINTNVENIQGTQTNFSKYGQDCVSWSL